MVGSFRQKNENIDNFVTDNERGMMPDTSLQANKSWVRYSEKLYISWWNFPFSGTTELQKHLTIQRQYSLFSAIMML